jgi:hypothetical protein
MIGRWDKQEIVTLKRLLGRETKENILKALPGRTWTEIRFITDWLR